MRVQIVTPTPQSEEIYKVVEEYRKMARPGTIISAVALDESVPPDADPTDPYVLPAILQRIQESERDGADAVIINCMEDPGLDAGRQLVDIPVIGPAQAAFHTAAMLGYKFSVLFPLDNPFYVQKLVEHYGLIHKLASVRILKASLELLATDRPASIESLVQSSLEAITEDGAHVIVPACTYTTGMAAEVQRRLEALGHRVPVIDPGLLAVRTAEAWVDLGVAASKRTYPRPLGITQPYW